MDSIVRAGVVYLFLLALFRIAGKRSLAEVTTFDLILSLIISEAIQQALIDTDNSLTNAFLLVITLVGLNILLSLVKQRSRTVERLVDGLPLVVIDRGALLKDRMDRERVDESDILHAARQLQGLSRLEDIDYAIVERSGGITVIPKPGART